MIQITHSAPNAPTVAISSKWRLPFPVRRGPQDIMDSWLAMTSLGGSCASRLTGGAWSGVLESSSYPYLSNTFLGSRFSLASASDVVHPTLGQGGPLRRVSSTSTDASGANPIPFGNHVHSTVGSPTVPATCYPIATILAMGEVPVTGLGRGTGLFIAKNHTSRSYVASHPRYPTVLNAEDSPGTERANYSRDPGADTVQGLMSAVGASFNSGMATQAFVNVTSSPDGHLRVLYGVTPINIGSPAANYSLPENRFGIGLTTSYMWGLGAALKSAISLKNPVLNGLATSWKSSSCMSAGTIEAVLAAGIIDSQIAYLDDLVDSQQLRAATVAAPKTCSINISPDGEKFVTLPAIGVIDEVADDGLHFVRQITFASPITADVLYGAMSMRDRKISKRDIELLGLVPTNRAVPISYVGTFPDIDAGLLVVTRGTIRANRPGTGLPLVPKDYLRAQDPDKLKSKGDGSQMTPSVLEWMDAKAISVAWENAAVALGDESGTPATSVPLDNVEESFVYYNWDVAIATVERSTSYEEGLTVSSKIQGLTDTHPMVTEELERWAKQDAAAAPAIDNNAMADTLTGSGLGRKKAPWYVWATIVIGSLDVLLLILKVMRSNSQAKEKQVANGRN